MHKNANKKEFLYTICAGVKSLDFPGKTEFVDTIRAGEMLRKVAQKKKCASRHIGHPKKQITKKY